MNTADLADATARALDLLDSNDPANSDPRLLRDPRLAEEARLTREAAAEVWLAVSPLRVAPGDVLPELMAKIDPSARTAPGTGPRFLPWLAVSGWAAAAALAFFLWPDAAVHESGGGRKQLADDSFAADAAHQPAPSPAPPTSREVRIRKEIVRLQERLAIVGRDRSEEAPRVMHLTAPGTVRRTAEESRQRVQSILTNALRSALEAESASPSEPAALVIERGWLPGGLPLPTNGGIIRHRNFPEQTWQEMGLLRSADGEYLDASANTIWSADPAGRGFIGREITGEEDVTRFNTDPDPAITKVTKPRTVPEGFIVENSNDNSSEIVIDQVPAPEPGNGHVVLVTDSSGNTEAIPLTPANAPAVPDAPLDSAPPAESGAFSPDVAGWTGAHVISYPYDNRTSAWLYNASAVNLGTIVFTLQGTTNVGSFQLVQRPLVPNGQPDKIIVEGGP
ncbi:MAG: hypothetical protein V4819_05615 [Verrucomicrobiota bacterium]